MKKIKPSAVFYKDYVIKLHELDKKVTIILKDGEVECKNLKEAKNLIDTVKELH